MLGVDGPEPDELFAEIGGEIHEIPNFTREAVVPRDGRAPLLLMAAGLSTVDRNRRIWAAVGRDIARHIDYDSLVACLRAMYAHDVHRLMPTHEETVRATGPFSRDSFGD